MDIFGYGIRDTTDLTMPKLQPKPWQGYILKMLKKPADSRSILWIYDPKGNSGKTTFAKWLAQEHNALVIDPSINIRKQLDVKSHYRIVVIDYPYQYDKFNYMAREKIKDRLEVPHLIVLSNIRPSISKSTMAYDRWSLYTIQDNQRLSWTKLDSNGVPHTLYITLEEDTPLQYSKNVKISADRAWFVVEKELVKHNLLT